MHSKKNNRLLLAACVGKNSAMNAVVSFSGQFCLAGTRPCMSEFLCFPLSIFLSFYTLFLALSLECQGAFGAIFLCLRALLEFQCVEGDCVCLVTPLFPGVCLLQQGRCTFKGGEGVAGGLSIWDIWGIPVYFPLCWYHKRSHSVIVQLLLLQYQSCKYT